MKLYFSSSMVCEHHEYNSWGLGFYIHAVVRARNKEEGVALLKKCKKVKKVDERVLDRLKRSGAPVEFSTRPYSQDWMPDYALLPSATLRTIPEEIIGACEAYIQDSEDQKLNQEITVQIEKLRKHCF